MKFNFRKPNLPKIELNTSLVIILIVAFLVGGLSGAVTGFYAGTFSTGNLNPLLGLNNLRPNAPGQLQNNTQGQGSKQQINADVQEESAVISAVKKTSPSVVSIVVSKYVSRYYGSDNFFPNDFFNLAFLSVFSFKYPNPNRTKRRKNKKSGVEQDLLSLQPTD